MRITGLASGMDIDNMVKETMRAHRIKIDKMQQKKDIVEIRQRIYRDTITEIRNFYDKYFDPSNKNSFLLSKNFQNPFASSSTTYVTKSGDGKVVSDNDRVVIANGVSETNSNYKVEVTKIGKAAELTLDAGKYRDAFFIEISYGGVEKAVRVNDISDPSAIVDEINRGFNDLGIKATLNADTAEITFSTEKIGYSDGDPIDFSVNVRGFADEVIYNSAPAENAIFKITSSDGKVFEANGDLSGNKFLFQGVEFNLTGPGTAIVKNPNSSSNGGSNGGSNGSSNGNSTALEDRIYEFIQDYNTLITSLNTKLSTRYNRDYQPLTADQKSELTEDEIKKWNAKVEEGVLYRDMYLSSVTSKLKAAMGSVVSSSGLKLKDIGIELKSEYGNKNGTYSVDTEKLVNAIEYKFDDVKALFTNIVADENMGSTEKYSKSGIFVRMKDIIFDNAFNSNSNLLKQVGYEGSSTFYDNALTRSLNEYQTRIDRLEDRFTKQEQLVYSQFARMESALNSLNSQQSYLMNMLG